MKLFKLVVVLSLFSWHLSLASQYPQELQDPVKDAISLTTAVCGLKGVMSCLPTAMKAYDEAK